MKTARTSAAAPAEPAGRVKTAKAASAAKTATTAKTAGAAKTGKIAEPSKPGPRSAAADQAAAATQRLADFLCFAVYSANLAFGRAYRPILDELGLTYTQYIAIIVLWESGSLTVSALGEKLFLESNTLTPILKKLEAMGYLRRQRDPSDERQVLVSLTDAGRDLRENAFGRNLVEATGLNAEEFRKLQKSVTTLRDNLIRHTHNE
jgi:DNA-binding MarR family transcriptional regulator